MFNAIIQLKYEFRVFKYLPICTPLRSKASNYCSCYLFATFRLKGLNWGWIMKEQMMQSIATPNACCHYKCLECKSTCIFK